MIEPRDRRVEILLPRSDLFYAPAMRPPVRSPSGRVCAQEDCGAILSVYNQGDRCALHASLPAGLGRGSPRERRPGQKERFLAETSPDAVRAMRNAWDQQPLTVEERAELDGWMQPRILAVADRIIELLEEPPVMKPPTGIGPRELELRTLIARGHSIEDVADRLSVSLDTARRLRRRAVRAI